MVNNSENANANLEKRREAMMPAWNQDEYSKLTNDTDRLKFAKAHKARMVKYSGGPAEEMDYDEVAEFFEKDPDHSDVVEAPAESGKGDLIHFGVVKEMVHGGKTYTWTQPTEERLDESLLTDVDKTWTVE